MISMPKKSKGLSIALNVFLWGVIILASITFIFWFFVSRYVSVQNGVIDETSERYLNNLLNVMLSNPYYSYVDEDDKLYRGLIDVSKLNNNAISKNDYKSTKDTLFLCISDLGYPNSMYVVEFMDLENNNGWINFFVSDKFDQKYRNELQDVFKCLKDKIADNLDDVFEWDSRTNSVKQSICDFRFINDCLKDKSETSYGGFASTKGLPITLVYQNGERHVGRMVGCLVMFEYNPVNAIKNIDIHAG